MRGEGPCYELLIVLEGGVAESIRTQGIDNQSELRDLVLVSFIHEQICWNRKLFKLERNGSAPD